MDRDPGERGRKRKRETEITLEIGGGEYGNIN